MGLLLSRLVDLFDKFRNDPARILMAGLDAAGKTTILYKIKRKEIALTTIPTLGFNVETVTPVKGVTFTVCDVGGLDKIRPLWRHYCKDPQGVLYVVDSVDRERMLEARDELNNVLKSDEMRGVPVVVLANKQDLPGAASVSEVAEKLDLHKWTDRKWNIHGTCATSGDGILEGMKEMSRLVEEFKQSSRF